MDAKNDGELERSEFGSSLGLLGVNPFFQGTFIGSAILIAVLFNRLRGSRQSE